jgi:hypothetical protein
MASHERICLMPLLARRCLLGHGLLLAIEIAENHAAGGVKLSVFGRADGKIELHRLTPAFQIRHLDRPTPDTD